MPDARNLTAAGADPVAAKTVHDLWWAGMLEGVLAVFFGVAAIFWPALTLVTLVYLFSAFVLAWGIGEMVHGLLSTRRRDTWWLTLVFGVVGLGVGLYLVRHPHVSLDTFILVVGLTLIFRGILDVVRAFLERVGLKADVTTRAMFVLVGLAAVAAGIILLMQPTSGGVAFVWILGLYTLVYGTLMMVLSFEARERLLGR